MLTQIYRNYFDLMNEMINEKKMTLPFLSD